MSNEILDFDKNTGPRTCPECGNQISTGELIKRYVMSYGIAKWPCRGCKEVIKCNSIAIQIIMLVGLGVAGVLFGVLSSHYDLGFLNIIYLIPGFAVVYLTFFYAKFERH